MSLNNEVDKTTIQKKLLIFDKKKFIFNYQNNKVELKLLNFFLETFNF